MKYTVEKLTQQQYVRVEGGKKINISPKGGDFTADEAKLILATAYGKSLVDSGILKIEGGLVPPAPGDVSAAGAGNTSGAQGPVQTTVNAAGK